MKHIVYILLLSLGAATVSAQSSGSQRPLRPQKPAECGVRDTTAADSCARLPLWPCGMGRFSWNGYDNGVFPLHEGFNALLSMSATVGLGGHHPSGVGFGRDISLAYASPLGKRTTYAVAANTSAFNWGGFHYNQAAVGGSLNYALGDKVWVSVEGYKNLVRPKSYLPYETTRCDSYLGGVVNMKWSDNVFIQVSVGTSTWR